MTRKSASFIKNGFTALLCAVVLFGALSGLQAEDAEMALLRKAIEKARGAAGKQLPDYSLFDQDKRPFKLSDYRGKPLLVSFIYTTCPDICNSAVASLAPTVESLKKEMGSDFNAVVVGFDAELDTPEMMKEFGGHHKVDYGVVRFASGDAETIGKMVEDFGFYFEAMDGGGFKHLGEVFLVDGKGKLVDQVVRTRIDPIDLRGPLKRLLSGEEITSRPVTLLGKLKALCLRYDPETGEYSLNYSYVLGVFMQALVILLVAWFYLKEDIRKWIGKKRGAADSPEATKEP